MLGLLGCSADERLLTVDAAGLPAGVGRPEPVQRGRSRDRIVGIGATMTGVTLIGGIGLVVFGAIDAVANGFSAFAVAVFVVGLVLVATHWGWVHVAEATADSIDARQARSTLDRNRRWLEAIKPYTRYEISTSVADDGSIAITRTRFTPVRSGRHSFGFVAETEHEEQHSGDEPAAAVTERAEHLRRQAALDTQHERERYEVMAEAYESALLQRGDEEDRVAARRAASAALSEQINANLRDPPLME